ncbi:MAG: AN1-type zinc finger domain-containing protein [Candidatus Hydrothermarchaeaceae archaeon]
MSTCAYCGAEESMPFTCKFCGQLHCANHHLPENHECLGLEKFKEARGKKPERWIYEPFHERYKKEPGRVRRKPLSGKIRGAITGVNTEKILYLILLIIAAVLAAEVLRVLL